jgi:hypothetical protein
MEYMHNDRHGLLPDLHQSYDRHQGPEIPEPADGKMAVMLPLLERVARDQQKHP